MSIIFTPSDNLGFFMEKVSELIPPSISGETKVYLAHLLQRMTKPENLFQLGRDGRLEDRAFCIQIFEAGLELRERNRSLLYQRVGDAILFYSGFFRPKISRDGLSLDYYCDLGRTAYSLSNNLRGSALDFSEIVEQFPILSDGISRLQIK